MAIQIADGFQLRVAKPLDDRQNVETVAQLDPTYGYEGQIVYVKDVKQFYTCYKDEYGNLAYKVMETGSTTPPVENTGIEIWVSGEAYEENDFVSYDNYIYKCIVANSDIDFVADNWVKQSDTLIEITKQEISDLLGLTDEELETMANLIADTEVRLDKTYSSSKIYQDIQQCLNDSKAFTLLELGKLNGSSYKVVTSTSEMTSESIIYLLANENTYDMYIVEESGTVVKIGNMDVNLDNYFTKAEIEADYLKKVDADGKFATITTVDGKVDKTDIVDNLTSIDTDKPLSANQGKVLKDELGLKANDSEVVKKTDIATSLDGKADYKFVVDNGSRYVEDVVTQEINNWLPNDNSSILINLKKLRGEKYENFQFICNKTDSQNWSCIVNGSNIFWKINYVNGVRTIQEFATVDNEKDVGVTTITPVNSGITGTIEYTVKNGTCYVSLFNVKSTATDNGLLISSTMPKPAINSSSAIYKQLGSGNIGIVYINKNTTLLKANINVSDIIGDCSFSYPVAE